MQINEIFASIDGEGIRTGYLVTFIRTQFCSLKCIYCDTKYSLDACDNNGNKQYIDMSVEEILQQCKDLGNRRITFTGGEPLIQKDAQELISVLTINDFEVNIETNGAVDIKPFKDINFEQPVDHKNVIFTMDWKSPYSGMRDKMIESNLDLLNSRDVLKFVVANKEDLADMKDIITRHKLKCSIFVSPVFGQIEGKDIVKYMQNNNLQNVRLQLQLHKYLWDPNMRGV